jgi:hypothetical protein
MLRRVFCAGDGSLGQRKLPLERQSDDPTSLHGAYREDVRWTYGGVTCVGLHVVGSNNDKDRTPEIDAEWASRTAADVV